MAGLAGQTRARAKRRALRESCARQAGGAGGAGSQPGVRLAVPAVKAGLWRRAGLGQRAKPEPGLIWGPILALALALGHRTQVAAGSLQGWTRLVQQAAQTLAEPRPFGPRFRAAGRLAARLRAASWGQVPMPELGRRFLPSAIAPGQALALAQALKLVPAQGVQPALPRGLPGVPGPQRAQLGPPFAQHYCLLSAAEDLTATARRPGCWQPVPALPIRAGLGPQFVPDRFQV